MKRVLLCLALCFLSLAWARAGEVFVVPLHGEISRAQFIFLRRAVKEAEDKNASALVLDMDTYGGELDAATKMREALFNASMPTLTYINTNAGSAGALVALSTKKIYMAPVSAIGAAAPVTSGGQDLSATMNDKVVSYFSGYFRSAAEHNGYNPDIAEAFISKEKEVKVGDKIIHAKGSLLTFSAQEATRVIDGKPLLASGIADSLDDLLNKAKLTGALHRIEPTGFETLAFWLTTLAPLLLLGGIVGVYIEIKTGGFGAAGVVAALCFTLFFAGHYIAGLAGWEVVALFIVGLALVLGELLVHPGTIIPGLIGAMMVFAALFWAMIDRYPGQPLFPTTDMLLRPVLNLVITGVLGVIVIAVLARYLPRTQLYRAFVLGAANAAGPSFSRAGVGSPAKVAVGAEGIARSILRPSGNAQFGDLLVDVVTQGEFIEPNAALRVLAVEGARIVVEAKR